MYYSDRNKEYVGYSSEEACEKEIERYNEKNNANIETYDNFIKFIELQWKFGNYVRNIGYLIIIVFYLIIVFIELNTNKLERKLEKVSVNCQIYPIQMIKQSRYLIYSLRPRRNLKNKFN